MLKSIYEKYYLAFISIKQTFENFINTLADFTGFFFFFFVRTHNHVAYCGMVLPTMKVSCKICGLLVAFYVSRNDC